MGCQKIWQVIYSCIMVAPSKVHWTIVAFASCPTLDNTSDLLKLYNDICKASKFRKFI